MLVMVENEWESIENGQDCLDVIEDRLGRDFAEKCKEFMIKEKDELEELIYEGFSELSEIKRILERMEEIAVS